MSVMLLVTSLPQLRRRHNTNHNICGVVGLVDDARRYLPEPITDGVSRIVRLAVITGIALELRAVQRLFGRYALELAGCASGAI